MRNEYIIDWPLLKKWNKESNYSGLGLAVFIYRCALLVCSIVCIVWTFMANMYSYCIYFALISLFCFYRAFLWNIMIIKHRYKRFVQTYGKKSCILTICFEDNEIVIKEEKTETKYNYSDILRIVEKDEIVYLRLQAKKVMRLYKSKFIDGTWGECKEKILLNNPNVKY